MCHSPACYRLQILSDSHANNKNASRRQLTVPTTRSPSVISWTTRIVDPSGKLMSVYVGKAAASPLKQKSPPYGGLGGTWKEIIQLRIDHNWTILDSMGVKRSCSPLPHRKPAGPPRQRRAFVYAVGRANALNYQICSCSPLMRTLMR